MNVAIPETQTVRQVGTERIPQEQAMNANAITPVETESMPVPV